ncbi:COP9/signalosome complex subunit Csn1 [Balamuthia mandrillaris]
MADKMKLEEGGEGGSSSEAGSSSSPATVSHKDFDLEGYLANYSGHTKIARALFIAEHAKDLESEALRLAVSEVKNTTNTTLYKEIMEKAGSKLPAPYSTLDREWVDSVDKRAQQQLERLELELNGYKTNLIKESIRMGHNDLGDFHYDRGDLNAALKCYVRTRDYCTTSKHITSMCLNVIKVSIEMGNFAHVINYVNKAEQTPDLQDPIVIAKLKSCAGLAHLENRKYKVAARKFLETNFELGNNFSDVISPQDVAIYGGLCALAMFDRRELKTKVIDNPTFKNFLELVPQVRELINDFYNCRYASCLNYLQELKGDLLLDLHLHDHVEALYQKIRNKALVQYFSPFISVDLNTMAQAFNTDVGGLEKELSGLIMEGSIQARIDSQNKILYARTANQRCVTFEKALKMGEEYQRNTKAMLLRVDLMKHDFVVRPREEMIREK